MSSGGTLACALVASLLVLHLLLSALSSTSFQLPHYTHRGSASARRDALQPPRRVPAVALHTTPSPAFEAGEEVVVVDDDGATHRTGVIEQRKGGWYTVRLDRDATRVKRRRSGLQRKSDGEKDDLQGAASESAKNGEQDGLPATEPVEIVNLDAILATIRQQYAGHGNIPELCSAIDQTISADTLRQIAHCHSHCHKWVIFSDLHVMPSTLPTCLRILDAVHEAALNSNAGILFLGDFWHHRGFVRVDCLNAVLDAMGRWTVPSILIPGNHDQVDWKGVEHALTPLGNAYRIGSSVVVNGEGSSERHPGPLILSQPTKFLDALFVPHTRDKSTMQSILSSKEAASSSALFVHADVKGASMNDLIQSEHGLSGSIFPENKHIYSGHFHKPHVVQLGKASSSISIRYVGSPYQTSFAEAGQDKALLLVDAQKQWRCIDEIPIDVGPRYHRVPSVRRFVDAGGADFREGDKVAVTVSQQELEEMRAQATSEEAMAESPFDAKLKELREAGVSVEIRDSPPQLLEGGLAGMSAADDENEIDLEDLSPRATLSACLDDEVESGELGETTAKSLLEGGLDLLREITDAAGGSDKLKSPPNEATVTELEIESVSVQGFGSFRQEVDYPLNNRGVVLLRGTNEDHGSDSNGAGKSTLAMASLWALAGSVDPRPTQDGKVSDVVNDLSKVASATVRGTINSMPFLVKRTKAKSSKSSSLTFLLDGVDMTQQSPKDTQALINDHFRNVDLLTRTVFHGQHAIGGLLESTDARLKDELSYLVSLEIWQQSASLARSKQRELMRKASELEGMLTLRGKDKARAEEKCNAAKIESDRREGMLESERRAFLLTKDDTASDSHIEGIEEAMNVAQAQLHESTGNVSRLEEELSVFMDSDGGGINDLRSVLQAKIDEENEAKATLHAKQRRRDAAAMELKSAERQFSLLQSEWYEEGSNDASTQFASPETCRTCGQPITSAESRQHVMESVQEKLTDATTQVDTARDLVFAATSSLEKARGDSEARELEVQICTKDLREAEETLSQKTEGLHKEIKAARLLQSDLSSEFARLVRQAKEISEAKLAKSQMQAHLDKLTEAFHASVAAYESCRAELEAIEVDIAELETDKAAKTSSSSLYASLADVFGPKGIQAFVLQNIVQALQHCSQAYLDELSDGSLQLRMEVGPNDSIIKQAAIRNPDGTWRVRPLSSLSGGQWRRCSLSLSLGFIQLASKRGKLRSSLLVLDEPLTHLDSAGRKSVGRLLRKMLSRDSRIGARRSDFGLSTILVILQEIAAEEIEECFDQIDEVIKRGGASYVVLDENREG